MIKTNINKFISYLLLIFPLALATGPFLPDLIISLSAILFLYLSFRHKLFKYYKNKFFVLFFLFYIIINISAVLSGDYIQALSSSLLYFRFGIFVLVIWYIIDEEKNFLKKFTISLFIFFLLILLDGYFQYFYQQSIFGFSNISPARLNLMLSEKKFIGGYISRLFPLLIGLLIYFLRPNIKTYLIISLILILSDTLVFLTGERTSLGLLFISTISIIILVKKYRFLRLITFSLSILIIIIISSLDSEIKQRNIDKTINELGLSSASERIYIFSKAHNSMIVAAVEIFKDKPLIGSGPNTFRIFCNDYKLNEYSCSTHPHNTYVQLLAETGIIGTLPVLIIFLLVSFVLSKQAINILFNKKTDYSDYQICLLICVLVTLWPAFPSQNFFNNYINAFYYLPIGFFISSYYNANNI